MMKNRKIELITAFLIILVLGYLSLNINTNQNFKEMKIENNESCKASILAPLAVHPEHQQKKICSRLIEFGLEK